MKYPVHERFATFQGEGVHMGRAAFFIRLFGCPVHCPWCDSAGTWHPKHVPATVAKMSALELAQEAVNSQAKIVVITGGEPAIHDLSSLCDAIRDEFDFGVNSLANIHLETSGSFPIMGDVDWITVSPKRWKDPIEEVVVAADEFKFIIEKPEDIEYYRRLIEEKGFDPERLNGRQVPIWLHPEWSQRDNPQVLSAISDAVTTLGEDYRAGWQLHKLYKVDTRDPRSAPPVPLGGDPAKGF